MKKKLLVILLMLSACTTTDLPSSTAAYSWLSAEELATHKELALAGDAASSLKVGDFFTNVKNDFKEASFWLRLSAEQANIEAANKLAFYLSSDPNSSNEAIYWYKRALNFDPRVINIRLGQLEEGRGHFKESIGFYCASYKYSGDFSATLNLAELSLKLNKPVYSLAWRLIYRLELTAGSVASKENNESIKQIESSLLPAELLEANSLASEGYEVICSDLLILDI